jgi:hypothetical protein
MKTCIDKTLKTYSAGFVILLLISIALFWGRFFCDSFLFGRMARPYKEIKITPSGLLPAAIENDPNVAVHSSFRGNIGYPGAAGFSTLGIADYFLQMISDWGELQRFENGYITTIATFNFDKDRGHIVYQNTYRNNTADYNTINEKMFLYAGPEGVSDKPLKELGRFIAPFRPTFEYGVSPIPITYDSSLHRFYKIDFYKRIITKGPEMKKGDNYAPIQIGLVRKGYEMIYAWWTPPQKKTLKKDSDANKPRNWTYESTVNTYYPPAGQFIPVLDQTGLILLIDRETLEIAGKAGFLPAPDAFFDTGLTRARPKDLLSFYIEPVALHPDGRYLGMGVAAQSREGTSMKIAVFDSNGVLLEDKNTGIKGMEAISAYTNTYQTYTYVYDHQINMDSSKAVFWGRPWSPAVTILRFMLENLHGPILSAATYSTADAFEASSGHRALFLLPNSFVAMKSRQTDTNPAWKLFATILLMLPSIILSALLAGHTAKDAANLGLSKNARLCWVTGVLAFSLVGFICYRLTRPKITLVTCVNCGKGRRPDMETCHRCGSHWLVPELQAPNWYVTD